MSRILHLKEIKNLPAFIIDVQANNDLQSRFDLYWNKDLGWLWATADTLLFERIVFNNADKFYPEVLPPGPVNEV